ncbi:NAD-dependent epimerase/dehydratase family protein [Archangium violaceum]|uniref:NAD-dependent epimerase/dehydratase family protein n=1 Tax=Archangium violaceum TaxID=83451 RepID=UPI00193C633F|nr:NAD-dependent epimerase/dehydratase family protein [Archangium violaceum]QRK10078.1 NAD-dependent epimerase/dehydratase family protein [Archangium violaceum]
MSAVRHCVVTGGLGFIGRALAEALVRRGDRVTLLARPGGARPPEGTTPWPADLRSTEGLEDALRGADVVFHLAANANTTRAIEEPRYDFEVNVGGTFNLLEAALRARARRFVYVSSAAVYGTPERFPMDELHPTRPFMPYGATKLSGELLCRVFHHAHGLETVIGRPFCVYGPGEDPARAMVEVSRFLRWHLNGLPIPVLGDARRKTRDFVHVDDVVSALLLLAEAGQGGEAYNIGSGEESSMEDLVRLVGEATGRPATLEERPHITDDTYRLVADISRLRALGYAPRVMLAEGVRALARVLGERPALPGPATRFRAGQEGETPAA